MKFILFVLLCAPALVLAQEYTTPVRVNRDTAGTDREPWMHLGPNEEIYISWVKVNHGVAGDIFFARSDDKGATFGPSIRVTTGATVNADLQRGAPFAVDPSGNIHMVWVEKRIGKQTDVWYVRSTDKGMTWTEAVPISDDSLLYMQDFPSVACDSAGSVYVSFLDLRDIGRGTATNDQLYLVKSIDAGITWSPAKRVSRMPGDVGGTCECCKQDIQAAKNGVITIAFRSNVMNRRDIFVVRSTDFGETFGGAFPVQAQVWTLNACPATGPNTHLTPDGELHLAWRDARTTLGKAHIYYDILPNGMTETVFKDSNNLRLDVNEELPNWPDIAIHKGYAVISYETMSNQAMYVLLGKDPASPPIVYDVLPGTGNKMFMATAFASDGTRYFAWQDAGGYPTNDIIFMKDIMPLPGSSVQQMHTASEVIPNPVRSGASITIYSATESAAYTIIDILGRTIYSGSLDILDNYSLARIPKITPGQYFLHVGSESFAIIVTD